MLKKFGARKRKVILSILLFSSLLFLPVSNVKAQNTDFPQLAFQTGKLVWEKFLDFTKKIGSTVASGLYRTTLTNAVNTIAYDTATWLGSGGRGQKPLFVTDFGQYAANIGDAAAGQFIESLGEKVFGVNVCSPSLGAQVKIGLGLVEQQRPGKPNCTLSEMYDNWDIRKTDPNFLKDLYGAVDPTGTDLGAALYVQNKSIEIPKEASDKASEYLKTFQGWLTPKDAGGKDLWMPQTIEKTNDLTWSIFGGNLLKDSGNALVDAAKVFTNQLALTAFKTQLQKIGRNGTVGTGYTGNYGLANVEDGPYSSGVSGVENIARTIIKPSFATRGDYDILSSLSICNQLKDLPAGPTDCVIDERFRQAIEQKKTIGESVKNGLLNGSASFGFKISAAGNPEEPSYLDGFPYRSMTILRKYRIIPVGWELAAEYIKNHPQDSDVTNNATLGKMIDCYSDNDGYGDFYRSWCAGLVDPDWVLKAPQNYCGQEGYGPQVISKISVPQGQDSVDYDSNGDGVINSSDTPRQVTLPNKLTVSRLDNYCVDEQSCIKENDDGSCRYTGYCEEEKREWRFDGESCEANFNTCETFSSLEGKTISLLKNTLSFCDEASLGCESYAIPGATAYNGNTKTFDWTKSSGNIYLNKNAESCDAENDGCRSLIRLSANSGANLLPDGNFENLNVGDNSDSNGLINNIWPATGHAEVTDNIDANLSDSGKVILVEGASGSGLYSFDRSASVNKSVLPKGFVFEPETSYTLSADVYIKSADRVVLSIGRSGGDKEEKEVSGTGWQKVSVTVNNNEEIAANQFTIYGYGAGNVIFYLDNIKLEVGGIATAFSLYGQKGLIHEKLLPVWLEEACYTNQTIEDYTVRKDAPAICRNYARKCSRDEVGCQGFTPVGGGAEIPAAVTDKDVCPRECEGYSTFIQEKNNFSTQHSKYFIADTANSCSAIEVGCEEFTNLDGGTSGGETKEYYSSLRSCVKPDAINTTCADFYVWSGTGESGQQLNKVSLQTNSGKIVLTEDDAGLCNSDIFNNTPSNYNSDCRQFYDQDGKITYHLYSRTVSCTADCHPYRLSNKNYLEGVSSEQSCLNSGYSPSSLHWNAVNATCEYCTSGGVWNSEHNACVYNAYPAESYSCSAAAVGCGEYRGNKGNNLKNLIFSDFENGNDGWNHGTLSTAAISGKQSYYVVANQYLNSIDYSIGTNVQKGQSYTLSFIAKSATKNTEVRAYLKNSVNNQEFSATPVVVKSDTWESYSINIPSLDHVPTSDELLLIKVSAYIHIDNIKLSLVTDRYYLTRDSWTTPNSCDSDNAGRPYPLYMLGCSAYKDRLGATNFLHSFDRLCQESAIGCEAFIDTKNSFSPYSQDYDNGVNIYTVPADEIIYAAYDTDKQCDSVDKGCELLGENSNYEGENYFTAVYLKNDPDKYNKTLCSSEGVGCDKWSTLSGGNYYFKDPGNAVCEWRQAANSGSDGSWGWYKKKIKRCGGDGVICASDSQCSAGQTCSLDNADNPCPTTQFKTFGQGGLGNEVYQPVSDNAGSWAGVCDAAASGCTEYIDPVSDFSEELVYNGDFRLDRDNNGVADGWLGGSNNYQELTIEGNNLYILTVESSEANFFVSINTSGLDSPIYELSTDNNLSSSGSTSLEVRNNQSKLFYVSRTIRFDDKNLFQVSNISTRNNNDKVSLKKAIINYQLIDEVNKNSCGGQASLSKGCVYFNERSLNGAYGLKTLDTSAFTKYDSSSQINSNNSNALIQVRPDRDCGSWLACKSYIQEKDGSKTCFEVASCDRLDPSGNCANFTVKDESEKTRQTYGASGKESAETIKNLSGYSKVGYTDYFQSFKLLPNNLYALGDMKQVGANVSISNGSFELYSEDDYNDKGTLAQRVGRPVGWNLSGHEAWTKDGANTSFTVVADPDTANSLLIAYPMVGKSFLQYTLDDESKYPLSEIIYVDPGVEYYLSYYINTSQISNASAEASVKIINGATLVKEFNYKNTTGWVFHSEKFQAPASGNIRIELSGINASGRAYIDDIKISPVLLVAGERAGANINNPFYTGKTCRLYPEEDSLSCEYFDDNGSLHRGEYGYCLEYDRYPGDPNACLLWWPVEKIQGSDISSNNNGAGYSGRTPLYYCVGANTGVDNNGLNYPNISGLLYEVEESLMLTINGEVVKNVNENYHSENNLSFPLRYGTNTVEVLFQADQAGINDYTQLRIAGLINYLDYSGNLIKKDFNIVDFFADFISNPRGRHQEKKPLSGGGTLFVEYSCGDQSHDELVTTMNCDVGSYGQQKYITNKNSSNCATSRLCNAVDGTSDSLRMVYTFYVPDLACSKVAQVVTPDGSNKAWANRINESAGYFLDCNSQMPVSNIYGTYVKKTDQKICYSSDKTLSNDNYTLPFGSIRLPYPNGNASESFKDDPYQWSSAGSEISNLKPLPYVLPSDKTPYDVAGGHMGQLYDKNSLSSLFAQSYGIWDWDNVKKVYVSNDAAGENWSSPVDWCSGNIRSVGESCAVAPEVFDIKGNSAVSPTISGHGFVNLTFNSRVNPEQLPVTAYEIDWGDGENLSISGLEESDRQDQDSPYSTSHSYEYWDLKTKDGNTSLANEMPTLYCPNNANYCVIKPRVKVRDNWGWCTEGRDGVACPVSYPATGVCMNSNRVTNGASCRSNYDSSYAFTSECADSAFPYCGDGFYEFSSVITVYNK